MHQWATPSANQRLIQIENKNAATCSTLVTAYHCRVCSKTINLVWGFLLFVNFTSSFADVGRWKIPATYSCYHEATYFHALPCLPYVMGCFIPSNCKLNRLFYYGLSIVFYYVNWVPNYITRESTCKTLRVPTPSWLWLVNKVAGGQWLGRETGGTLEFEGKETKRGRS